MPYGIPKTEEERQAAHQERYGNTDVPERQGIGPTQQTNPGTASPVEIERRFDMPGNGFNEKITEAYRKNAELIANLLTIKMNNWIPWYITKKAVLSDTTAEKMYSDMVRPGRITVLTHVSAKEATNTPTTIEISVERGGETLVLNRDTPAAADRSIDWDGQVLLSEGDRVKVTFYGGTSTNVIDISVSGYEIKA